MAISNGTEPWMEGGEKYRGRRLLPHIIDYYARKEPDRVFAAIAKSEHIADGFQDVNMKTMAAAVDSVAWWIDRTFANVPKQKRTLAYIGTADLLYPIILFAGIKTGWKVSDLHPKK